MERFFTVDEIAKILNVPKSWIYGRIHKGNLPFPYIKVGHYVRFPENGIRNYIESVTTTPNRQLERN